MFTGNSTLRVKPNTMVENPFVCILGTSGDVLVLYNMLLFSKADLCIKQHSTLKATVKLNN